MKKEWQEATEAGDCEKVSLLLEEGEDINSLDRYGQTALMNTVYRGDINLVKFLVGRGAKLDIAAKLNLTALMLAVINEHNEIVRILVQAGANTELKGSKGSFERTPIEYARECRNDEIVNILSSCKLLQPPLGR